MLSHRIFFNAKLLRNVCRAPRKQCASSAARMPPALTEKYEINADMGEGFGRWKLVRTDDHDFWCVNVEFPRDLMRNS